MNGKRPLKNPTVTKIEAVCPICERQVSTYLFKGQRKIDYHTVTQGGSTHPCQGAGRYATNLIEVSSLY